MRKFCEEVAFGVHIGLALGHGLSAWYNRAVAKKTDGWTTFHIVAGLVDLYAAGRHLRRVTTME